MTDDNLDDVQKYYRKGLHSEGFVDKINAEYDETFAADQAKLSVGKPISELSVFEKEVRNQVLNDCIEKMERAIELIRKMKV